MTAPSSSPSRASRRGFLLPSAFVVGLLILGLATGYELLVRHQTARGHRFRGALTGEHLARGAVEVVLHLVRDLAQHPTELKQGEAGRVEGKSLEEQASQLEADNAQLAKDVEAVQVRRSSPRASSRSIAG